MQKKVLITDGVHPLLPDGFQKMGFEVDYHPNISLEEVHQIIHQYEGIIINSKIICDKNLLDKAIHLKFLGRLGSGMEIIDQSYAAQKGIAVYNSPAGNCNAVAEHALGMLLTLANKLTKGDSEVRQKDWQREANRGFEIIGKTVSIIGFGHTGSAFAKKLRGMDVRILAYDKYKTDYAAALDYVEETDMATIFRETDILSLHLPLTPEVIHLVNDAYLSNFEKNIILINTSRGKVVPTQTLVDNLDAGKLLGVCLDVFENEKPQTFSTEEHRLYDKLYNFTNTVFTPHVAGWTVESKQKLAAILLEKVQNLYKTH